MKSTVNDVIWNIWNAGGPLTGDSGATHGRVTVEIGWQLRSSGGSIVGPIGNKFYNGPVRWFQRTDNSQVETEIPNIQTIDIDRELANDAATCKIVMVNQVMRQNSQANLTGTAGSIVGEPGYYWPGHGDSTGSHTRWGWNINAWNDVIQPNALIRTYQGYGGKSLSITAALAAGNIVQTGTWLVDDVSMDAKTGQMTISCRDMAKLLIQQTLYPPLVPLASPAGTPTNNRVHYPLYYYRFVYVNHTVVPYGPTIYNTGFTPLIGFDGSPGTSGGASGSSPLKNALATSDQYPSWVSTTSYAVNDIVTLAGIMYICILAHTNHTPPNATYWSVLHTKGHAIDGDPDTYWLSNGHLTSTAVNSYEFLQYDIDNGTHTVQGINIQPYAGNYIMYVSIMVGGTWQGSSTIPYSGTDYTGTYNPAIPYVVKQGVGWETPATIDLGGVAGIGYQNAQKIRLTFTHLAKTSIGPAFYRAGLRELQVGTFSNQIDGGGRIITGMSRSHVNGDEGYWMCGSDGNVFAFGADTKLFGSEGGKTLNGKITAMAGNPTTAAGYRLLGSDGGIFDFGDLYFHGSLPGIGVALPDSDRLISSSSTFAIALENGDQGHSGYYILLSNGAVYSFGTAVYHGNFTLQQGQSALYGACGMGVIANGYFITDTLGNVQAFGAAVLPVGYHRPTLTGEIVVAIEPTSDGLGFWLSTSKGNVFNYGTAGNFGSVGVPLAAPVIDMSRSSQSQPFALGGYIDDGYWLVAQDGGTFAFGNANFSGSLPQQYSAVQDGNYSDYSDIITDMLLWAGWWFYNPTLGTQTPGNVFGTIQTTGIYAPDNLTEDFFDQKPLIDVINTLKEIVGFITYADEIGAYHFKLPNIFAIGNFLDTGTPTARMAAIDEKIQITDYTVDVNDTDARSQIIIGTEDPALRIPGTKSVTLTSQWGPEILRGLVVPALWVNGQFLTTQIQTTMAQLIDLHLFLQQRQGSVTMLALPILQIDDQVQIFERSTSETYIHYVAGYTTHMDLESGEYTQTLTTHWMGDGTAWFLKYVA